MLLFRPEHVPLILNDLKTQTRRLWKKRRAIPGAIHQARTELYGKPFAFLKIKYVYVERLGDISPLDIVKEGYQSITDYKNIWIKINGSWDPEKLPYVIEFRRITQ